MCIFIAIPSTLGQQKKGGKREESTTFVVDFAIVVIFVAERAFDNHKRGQTGSNV